MYKIKKCKECGKEFRPKSARQMYCSDQHYRACPVCGKPVPVKVTAMIDPPRCCSTECKLKRMKATNLELYGVTDAGNTPEALAKRRKTNLERYGYEDAGNRPEAKEKRKQTNLERYGVENSGGSAIAAEHRRETNLKKFGFENAMQNPEIVAKAKQTNLEKYGVENPRQADEIKEKIKATNLEKYGVEWAIAAPEVKAKSDATMLEKYGTLYPAQLKEIQDKIEATCLKKYGVRRYLQTDEFKSAARQSMLDRYGVIAPINIPGMKEKVEATNNERYGVPYAFLSEESIKKCQRNLRVRISSVNKSFGAILDTLGVSYQYEYFLEGKWFDIYLPDQKVCIEIDPTYTHSIEPSFYYPHGNDNKYYHRNKSQVAEKHGLRCIHVFDWDNSEDIAKLVHPIDTVLYARNCKIDFISTEIANEFMNQYHIQHSVYGQVICIGLIYDNEIVSVMTFGKPRYTNKYQFELLRFATVTGVRVIGGASKLFRCFVETFHPDSVISYCNRSKFTGSVYTAIGMKLLRKNPPSKLWSKDKEVITHMLLQQRGYDQLFNTNYGKNTSNEELMRNHGWRSLYDCGQDVYLFES